MRILRLITPLALVLSLASCGDDGGDETTGSSASSSTTAPSGGSAGGSAAKLTPAQIDERLAALASCLEPITGIEPTRSENTDPGYIKFNAKSGMPMDVYVFSTAAGATDTTAINRRTLPDAVIEQFDHAVVTLNGNPADEQKVALDCARKAA